MTKARTARLAAPGAGQWGPREGAAGGSGAKPPSGAEGMTKARTARLAAPGAGQWGPREGAAGGSGAKPPSRQVHQKEHTS